MMFKTLRMRATLYVALALALLPACSQLAQTVGVTAPQTIGEKLAYAEGQDTAFNESIVFAAKSGSLTKAQGDAALKVSHQAMTAITAGKTAVKNGDSATAAGKLAEATSFLSEVSSYLKGGGG